MGVLEGDYVFAAEFGVVDEVLPHFGLDVHALDRFPGEDICVVAVAHRNDMGVVGEDLEGDRVDQVTLSVCRDTIAVAIRIVNVAVARKIELDQVLCC